jgi:hypothetical protein
MPKLSSGLPVLGHRRQRHGKIEDAGRVRRHGQVLRVVRSRPVNAMEYAEPWNVTRHVPAELRSLRMVIS